MVAIKSGFNMLMYHTKVSRLRLIRIPRQMIATLWSSRRRRFVTRHLRGRMTMLHGHQQLNCHCWRVQMLTFSTVCNGNEHRPHLRKTRNLKTMPLYFILLHQPFYHNLMTREYCTYSSVLNNRPATFFTKFACISLLRRDLYLPFARIRPCNFSIAWIFFFCPEDH